MERSSSAHSQEGTFVAIAFGGVAFGVLYLLVDAYHIRTYQVIEFGGYLALLLLMAAYPIFQHLRRPNLHGQMKPFVVPAHIDKQALEKAHAENSIVLGYNRDLQSWEWSDNSRAMQGILTGMSGAGKTTMQKNIISQDLARTVGGKFMPILEIDGKGDFQFIQEVLPYIHRAGRMNQFRLISPSHPKLSHFYNPFYCPDGDILAKADMVFHSFDLEGDDFFLEHQKNYLKNACRVLYWTGKGFNFYDLIVFMRDSLVQREQIERAEDRMRRDERVTVRQRNAFKISANALLSLLADNKKRMELIQGLLNQMETFQDDELAAITSNYTENLTIDQVLDEGLILFVSLNININTTATTALGRILLQDIQLTIGKRYKDPTGKNAYNKNQPISSIGMDEVAPFVHKRFPHIVNTARGANCAFLYSTQSLPQFEEMGRAFSKTMASSPNTTISFRTRDEDTAQFFIKASAEEEVTRQTKQMEKGFLGIGGYRDTGRITETTTKEHRSQDQSIKNLPKGQCEILESDDTLGTKHGKIQVRPPQNIHIPGFQPKQYDRLLSSRATDAGLNLQFREADAEKDFKNASRVNEKIRGLSK